MKMVTLLAVIVGLFGIVACENGSTAPSSIPPDVSYTVIGTDIIPGIKRSLDVRLNQKVSQDVLRAIALKLKSNDSRPYDRTFIAYYLPGMTVNAGAWATTHFNPTLEVRILGLSVPDEKALVTEPLAADREVTGSWLDEITYAGSRITIYKEGGTLYIEWRFTDWGTLKEKLVEKPSSLGQRFDKKEGSSSGDHWVIDQEGNLQIRDNLGLISTAKKTK